MRIATRKTALALLIVTAFLALPANAANVSIGPGDIDDYFLIFAHSKSGNRAWPDGTSGCEEPFEGLARRRDVDR